MGTNLSQVFIANTGNFSTSGDFTGITTNECGVWDFQGDTYRGTALYEKTVAASGAVVDTSDSGSATDPVISQATVANPLWLYTDLQFVQNTSGNPIASPLINTRNIKRVQFDPYEATAGHLSTLTPNATFTGVTGDVTIKIIFRAMPTDQLSFYDSAASNYTILSGSDQLPLGIFNTTNHKAISVEVSGDDFSSNTTFVTAAIAAIQANDLLNKSVTATGSTALAIQSRHVGLIFDVVVTDGNGDDLIAASAASNFITEVVTGQALGTGNPWQVLGEEIRCRSRYGNFNRMYLPQNMATYTVSGNEYHKVVIEYEHNWPNSSGIAPAGARNQVVLYVGAASALAAGSTNIDEIFNLANVTASQEFVW